MSALTTVLDGAKWLIAQLVNAIGNSGRVKPDIREHPRHKVRRVDLDRVRRADGEDPDRTPDRRHGSGQS